MPPGKAVHWDHYLYNHSKEEICKWSIKLNIHVYLLYLHFQQNQCLNIKKHAVHNIHILAWGLIYACGPPGNCPVWPCVDTALHATCFMYVKFFLHLVQISTGKKAYNPEAILKQNRNFNLYVFLFRLYGISLFSFNVFI